MGRQNVIFSYPLLGPPQFLAGSEQDLQVTLRVISLDVPPTHMEKYLPGETVREVDDDTVGGTSRETDHYGVGETHREGTWLGGVYPRRAS